MVARVSQAASQLRQSGVQSVIRRRPAANGRSGQGSVDCMCAHDEGASDVGSTGQAAVERQGDRAPRGARHRERVRDRHLQAARADRPDHARLRLHEHRLDGVGDHLHRRRRRHPALPRLRHRRSRRAGAPVVPRDRVARDLRRAADRGGAHRVQPPDPPAHARARRREALLLRLPEGRAPDGDDRVGGQRARDLLPGLRRPARSRRRCSSRSCA